jgi:hypothetical protein
MRNPLDGTGDRVLGYAYCPQCERIMQRTDAKIVAEAALVQGGLEERLCRQR